MRKPVFKLFCLLLCVLVLEGCVHRQQVFLYDIGNHLYLIYDELGDAEVTITVTDCDDAAGDDLEVPAEIGGLPVISIEDSAFGGCSNLTSITIPDSVTSIGDGAFEDCVSLTSIIIPQAFHSEDEARRLGLDELWPEGFSLPADTSK